MLASVLHFYSGQPLQNLSGVDTVSGARGAAISPTAMLNAMHMPAIALDRHGFAVDANTAAKPFSTTI